MSFAGLSGGSKAEMLLFAGQPLYVGSSDLASLKMARGRE